MRPGRKTVAILLAATTLAASYRPPPDDAQRRADLERLLRLQMLQAQQQAALIQQRVLIQGRVRPAQPPTGDAATSVYVPDSSKASEQLRLADRLIGQKEWGKGVEVYQEIIDTLGDRVAPLESDPTRYVTVARTVEKRLATLPPDGLTAYRNKYEAKAHDLLISALAENTQVDLQKRLISIQEHYLVTKSGLEASLRLTDLWLDAGDAAAALTTLHYLLDTHPDLQTAGDGLFGRPAALFRAVVAARQIAKPELAQTYQTELKSKFATDKALVAGADAVLSDLAAAYAVGSPTSRPTIADWPMPGGDASRSATSGANARANALVATIPYVDPRASRVKPAPFPAGEVGIPVNAFPNFPNIANVLPSVSGNELFFQNGARVWGVALDSGLPLPGWAATYRDGTHVEPGSVSAGRSSQYSVTVTEDSVLATMGGQDPRITDGPVANTSRLVRLNRVTGKTVWSRPVSAEGAPLKDLFLSGSPLVLGDSVYVAARGSKGNGFDDAYVACFDYATGRSRWCTYLASATAAQDFSDVGRGSATVTHLSAAGGRIFVQTNLGAVAAVDAVGGRPEWIATYPHVEQTVGVRAFGNNGVLVPSVPAWAYNPPLISGQNVFFLPADSADVLVLDASDGATLSRVQRAAFGDAIALLAADDKGVLLCSAGNADGRGDPGKITEVAWRAVAQPAKDEAIPSDAARAATLWSKALTPGPVVGRPFVTDRKVYVPLATRLWQLDRRRGGYLETMTPPPQLPAWTGDNGQGNVVVAGDKVVIATPSRIEIWTDLAVAEANYNAEIAASPRSALPRLRWAEVLFIAGQTDKVTALLDEAASLLASDPDPAAQTQLYQTSLSMADRTAAKVDAATSATRPAAQTAALSLYAHARAAARTPDQQVEWRTRQADLLQASNDLPAAVATWQEILIDPALRRAAAETGGTAGEMARERVAEVLDKSPAAYAPVEKSAVEKLAVAKDRDALLEVAAAYPNSSAAPQALLRAAQDTPPTDLAEATRLYREIEYRYPRFDRRADVIEGLSRAYVAAGKFEVAMSRLAAGARLFPDHKLSSPLARPGGGPVPGTTFAQAREALRAAAMASAPPLVDFGLPSAAVTAKYRAENRKNIAPVIDVPDASLPGVNGIVPAIDGSDRSDRLVVARADGTVAAVAPGKPGVLWSTRLASGTAQGCAWAGETAIVWDAREVAAVAPDGRVAWRADVPSAPLPDVNVLGPAHAEKNPNAEAVEADLNRAVINGRVIINGNVRNGGFIVRNGRAVFLGRGRFNLGAAGILGGPVANAGPEQISLAVISGDKVVIATTAGRLRAFAVADGAPAWQSRPAGAAPGRLLATPEFVVADFGRPDGANQAAGAQLVALSADDGAVRWRHVAGAGDAIGAPQNFVLSPDGTLVFTIAGALCSKDLFDPGPNLTAQRRFPDTQPFAGMTAPDQLLLRDGAVFAICADRRTLSAFAADGLEPLRRPGNNGEVSLPLVLTGSGDASNAHLVPAGDHLYVYAERSLQSIDLRTFDVNFTFRFDTNRDAYSDVVVGRGFALATVRSATAGPAQAGPLLAAYVTSTPESPGKDSGLYIHSCQFPASVTFLHPAQGGVFTLSSDNTLRFLKGNAAGTGG